MDAEPYVVNVEGAVVDGGEYLLIERAADEEHAAGSLAFPGGKVENPPEGEDAIEATARRELREEVGIEVGAVEYVHSRTFVADDGTPCLNVVTRCEHVGGEPRVREPGEVAAVHWVTPEELRDRDDVPGFLVRDVERIEDLRDGD